ncbi:hypothetical protein [Streptomyces sp. NPDC127119]|uniref:hypothetical protein n=1 Tax=Streptomyces sp. NPDC127119 TaxID=3345370 RepID=UPI0036259750
MTSAAEFADVLYAYSRRSGRFTAVDLFSIKSEVPQNLKFYISQYLVDRLGEESRKSSFMARMVRPAGRASSRFHVQANRMMGEYDVHREFAAAYREFSRKVAECQGEIGAAGREQYARREGLTGQRPAVESHGSYRPGFLEHLGSAVNRLESAHVGSLRKQDEVRARVREVLGGSQDLAAIRNLTTQLTQQTQNLDGALRRMRRSVQEARDRFPEGKPSASDRGLLRGERPTQPNPADAGAGTARAAAWRAALPAKAPSSTSAPSSHAAPLSDRARRTLRTGPSAAPYRPPHDPFRPTGQIR